MGRGSARGSRLSVIVEWEPYGGLHGRTCSRGNSDAITKAGHLAQSISGIRHHDAIPRIHFRLPQDRPARLRHDHHPIHAAQGVHRAEDAQDVSPRVSRSWHLLRKRSEQDSPGHRRSHPPGMVCGARRIHAAGGLEHIDLRALAAEIFPAV